MSLEDWLRKEGRGSATRLVREAEVTFPAIRQAAAGTLGKKELAERISRITGVPVETMWSPGPKRAAPKRGKRAA